MAPMVAFAQPDLNFKRIRLDWPYVEVYLSVGCDGIKNYSLQRSDLEIVEDDRVLDDFGIWCPDPTTRCPISVGLVFDASDSMVGEGNAGARDGGLRFVSSMDDVVDEACVIHFNSIVTIFQQMTTDTLALKRAVNRLPAIGATALWDALYTGLLLTQQQGSNQCRAVIVLTDGEDNSSSRDMEEVIAFAVLHNIRVFPVGYGDQIREDQLSLLAQITGGNYYQTPDAGALAGIYKEISTVIYEFFQECIVDFEPRCADGHLHEVELRVPDLCNGSASKTRWYKAPLDSTTFRTKHISLGDISVSGGAEAWLPVEIVTPFFRENFYPFTLDLHFDKQRLQLDRVETPAGTFLAGMEVDIAESATGGRLRTPDVRVVDTTGTLCYIVFRTATTTEPVSVDITTDSSSFTKGCHIPVLEDGRVTLTPSVPGVVCTVTAPRRLRWDAATAQYIPSPFEVRVRFENTGTLAAYGGKVRLAIDPQLYEFVEPTTSEQTVGDLPPEGVEELTWILTARPQETDTQGQLCFSATFANHPNVACCVTQDIIAAGAILSCGFVFPDVRYDEATRSFFPNPFDLWFEVGNLGKVASELLEAELLLPQGLYLEGGVPKRKTLTPEEIGPGGSAAVSWPVRIVSLTGGDHFAVRAVLRNGGDEYRTCGDTLLLPFIPPTFTTGVTVRGNATLCRGDSVVLEAEEGYVEYRWNNGARTRSIVVKSTGTYVVSVLDGQGRVGRSAEIEILVYPVPGIPLITREHNTLITTADPPLQWFRNGQPIPGANASRYVVTEPGEYTVESWNVVACKVVSDPVLVSALPVAVLPASPVLSLAVFPDPSSGHVTARLETAMTRTVSIRILNVLGQLVRARDMTITPGMRDLEFDLRGQSRGAYLVICQTGSELLVRRLLLE
jgi:hypothetical protein